MGREKGNIEFVDQKVEQREIRKVTIRDIFDGTLLTRAKVVRQLPFILFLTLLIIVYIGNRYHAEKLIRQSLRMQTSLKELRARAISTASELEFISKQSEVMKLVERHELDLTEATTPPHKIVVTKERRQRDVH